MAEYFSRRIKQFSVPPLFALKKKNDFARSPGGDGARDYSERNTRELAVDRTPRAVQTRETKSYTKVFSLLMASPLARIIAQLAVATAGIVSRAFVSAYSQAVHSEY